MTFYFFFSDKPGPPENLQVSDIHAEYVKLDWSPPTDDGGAEILGSSRFQINLTFSS